MINIYAGGVSDLSTARYFAAMGVSFIGFEVDQTNIKEILEIANWIEGPGFIAELNFLPTPQELYDLSELEVFDYIKINFNTDLVESRILKTYSFEDVIANSIQQIGPAIISVHKDLNNFSDRELDTLLKICKHEMCFLDIYQIDEKWLDYVKNNNAYGLVLRGQPEGKTGLISVESLDEIFEYLED